jgi:uncharacterized Zn-finger protein
MCFSSEPAFTPCDSLKPDAIPFPFQPPPILRLFVQLPQIERHRSNAQSLVASVPVIEVASNVAMCDGGGGATGHPIEYVKLDTRDGVVAVPCKYCGLRFRRAEGHHHH